MLANHRAAEFSIACLTAIALWPVIPKLRAVQQTHPTRPIEATITKLVESGAKFNGKRVRALASFHSDGRENSVLMEPNCGRPNRTSEPPPQGEAQCQRGVVPRDSDRAESDPGNTALDRVLAQNPLVGTTDKYITAEFTGIFRCVPSCTSPKYFSLEIERVENLKVEMKDINPHPPTG